jgi:hypothetical protein
MKVTVIITLVAGFVILILSLAKLWMAKEYVALMAYMLAILTVELCAFAWYWLKNL